MSALVTQAMEEGAMGLTTALIYAPSTYAKTPELIDLAKVSARCGGMKVDFSQSKNIGVAMTPTALDGPMLVPVVPSGALGSRGGGV